MSKVVLTPVASGYNLQTINDNFQKLEDELNNKVLYRDNPVGEPNTLLQDIDVNGKRLYNLPEPVALSEPARLQDVVNSVTGIVPANMIPASDGAGGTLWDTVQGFITKITSSLGSSVIGFINGATGSVMRLVSDKLKEKPSPADFGAVGNGIADDTAAIQAFANAHYALDFGDTSKIYKVVSPITLRTGTTLHGTGATIKQATNNTEIFNIVAKSNIHAYGLRFEGVGSDFIDSDSSRSVAFYGGTSGDNIHIHDCEFVNFSYTPARLQGNTRVWIHNNKIVGPGTPILTPITSYRCYGLLADSDCDGVMFHDNDIRDVVQGIILNRVANFSVRNNRIAGFIGQHGVYGGAGLVNGIIDGNKIFNVYLNGIKVQPQNSYGDNVNVSVTNNLVWTAGGHGIILTNGAADVSCTGSITGTVLTVSTVPTGALYVGSLIAGVGVSPGSYIASFGTGSGGVGTYNLNVASTTGAITINATGGTTYCKNCLVSDNVVRTTGGSNYNIQMCIGTVVSNNIGDDASFSGLYYAWSDNTVIVSNVFRNAKQSGIRDGFPSTNTLIDSNKILDCAANATAGDRFGILVQDLTSVSLMYNEIRDINSKMEYGIYGSGGVQSGARIEGNTAIGATAYGARFLTGQTATAYRFNSFSGVSGSVTSEPVPPTVASAAQITLSKYWDTFYISGTTNIAAITANGHSGRTVRLVFLGALTVTDTVNLKINGNFVTTADDVLTLTCDGTNWYENSRSAN